MKPDFARQLQVQRKPSFLSAGNPVVAVASQVDAAGVEESFVPRRAEEEVMLLDLLPVRSPHLTRLRRQPREFVGRIVVQPPWFPHERGWKQNVRPRTGLA